MAGITPEDPRALRCARPGCEDEEGEPSAARESFFERELIRKHRTVVVSEEISPELTRRVLSPLLWLDAQGKDPIRVLINSPGGSADDGFAIFDVLRALRAPVSTICVGITASAGTIIFLAAPRKRRLCLPNARLLIHQPATVARGPAKDVEITAQEIVKLRDRANRLISEECGHPLEKVQEDTQRDYWLGPEEAEKYGLVGRIVRSLSEI